MDNQTYGNLCLAASIGIKYEGVCKWWFVF
jgi:hypothetical protein